MSSPLLSLALLFGGTFILLTQALCFSVRAVVVVATASEKDRR